MSELDQQASGGSEIDVDSLMSDIESGKEINAAPAKEAAPVVEQAAQEMEFTWNGKPVKAPVDRFKQWASQGYDYAQKMQEFNAKQSAFERSQKEFEPLKSRYSEIDKYARENPQWLEHVNSQYLSAIGQAQADGKSPAEIQEIRRELNTIKEELTSERQTVKQQEEDKKLDSEIRSIQEKYKDLDWNTPNDNGKTMETQVLEFGIQNGIKNFEQAFKLFNHDNLIALHASKAKEQQVASKQAQNKAGLLGSTPAPTKLIERDKNIKNKNYNDITRELLQELGIA